MSDDAYERRERRARRLTRGDRADGPAALLTTVPLPGDAVRETRTTGSLRVLTAQRTVGMRLGLGVLERMPAKFYRGEPFLHPQENQAFRCLCNAGARLLDAADDARILGNVEAPGLQIDAIVLKRRAIIIVDFKHYGGDIRVTEATPWVTSEGMEVRGGNRDTNPFKQVDRYKKVLMSELGGSGLLPSGSDLGHVSGLVIFTRPARVDASAMSEKAAKWFHAADFIEGMDVLRDAASPRLDFPPNCLDRLVEFMPVAPYDLKASEAMVPSSEVAKARFDAEREIHQDHQDRENQRWWSENGERISRDYEEACRGWRIHDGLEAVRRAVERRHPGSDLPDRIVASLGEALEGLRPLRVALNECRPLTDADVEGILESHGISPGDFQWPQAGLFGAK